MVRRQGIQRPHPVHGNGTPFTPDTSFLERSSSRRPRPVTPPTSEPAEIVTDNRDPSQATDTVPAQGGNCRGTGWSEEILTAYLKDQVGVVNVPVIKIREELDKSRPNDEDLWNLDGGEFRGKVSNREVMAKFQVFYLLNKFDCSF